MNRSPSVWDFGEDIYVLVESVDFHRDVSENPHDADDVETHEAGSGGVAASDDRVEGDAVAVESDEDEDCDVLV